MYAFRDIEFKWQQRWKKINADKTPELTDQNVSQKCYVLEMLPYPSGKIHMGHVRNYCIGDVLARFKRAQGHPVLHPMGWDAFGLPAENAAMQNHSLPQIWTYKNIELMKEALLPLGLSYDWDCEVATCDPEYYGHEQRFFLEMYEKGLVYQKESWVNWDPVDGTVLANEQVIDGKGWRSGATVVKKRLKHWCLRITTYADKLLENLEQLKGDGVTSGWPEKVLTMQRNWIGRSEGALVQFELIDPEHKLDEKLLKDPLVVFTTRPETLFGASFCALACDHPLVEFLAKKDTKLAEFIQQCQEMPVTESALSTAEKHGYNTGILVRNPLNPEQTVPVFVANFVLMEYGTGAVFGCPAHDERDFDFAKKYDLPITPVIQKTQEDALPYIPTDGYMVHSEFLDGLTVLEARSKAINWLEEHGKGTGKTTYRLRDWTVSRQRYWGCPIPVIHCPTCGIVPVDIKDLPVRLPDDATFDEPGNPLDRHPTWKHTTCPKCGQPATRETDTLDTFFESSWYFLRYCCAHAVEPLDKQLVENWMPVDYYIGGIEHAVLHLLYARFFTMVLKDLGYVSFEEPFTTLLAQGMVCHVSFQDENGQWLYPDEVERKSDGSYVTVKGGRPVTAIRAEKMSKSKKNIVDPAQMVETYGADALRIFIMSDTPYDKDFDWNTEALDGAWRYVNKIWRLCETWTSKGDFSAVDLKTLGNRAVRPEEASDVLKKAHSYLKRFVEAVERFAFHKALAFHRELTRELENVPEGLNLETKAEVAYIWLSMIAPFAPHFACEAFEALFKPTTTTAWWPWPTVREDLTKEERITVAIQVNGKLRGTLEVDAGASQETVQQEALALESVRKFTDDKELKKAIFVPNKLLNLVVA